MILLLLSISYLVTRRGAASILGCRVHSIYMHFNPVESN
jgi:hypothetical protein